MNRLRRLVHEIHCRSGRVGHWMVPAALWACDESVLDPKAPAALAVEIVAVAGNVRVADQVTIHVEGPTPKTVSAQPGETVTISGLSPGSYTIAVEGFLAGDVEWYDETSVTVQAGSSRNASVSARSFTPVLQAVASAVGVGDDLAVGWSAVSGASQYEVEWSTSPGFGNAQSQTTTSTSFTITFDETGSYYVRVRAINRFGSRSRVSSGEASTTVLEPLVITTELLPTGFIGAAYVGPLEASGGDGSYAWSVLGGELPAGLELSGADLSGMPDGTGTSAFTLQVSSGGLTTVRGFIITVTIAWASVHAGNGSYTCGLSNVGNLYCWGQGWGIVPQKAFEGTQFRSVDIGHQYGCGITTSSVAVCWGFNDRGQLGDGTMVSRVASGEVIGGLSFESIDVGHDHTCGVTTAGIAYCWGRNDQGQLGHGSTGDNAVPVPVSCGLTPSGDAYCWGFNIDGQLGDGTTMDRHQPVKVTGDLTFTSLDAGCGVTTGGEGYCWGPNNVGQLGDGSNFTSATPVKVLLEQPISSVAGGGGPGTPCALTVDAAAYCWGENDSGQMGNGTTNGTGVPNPVPTAVVGGLSFAMLSVGVPNWSCGVTTSAEAYCWGSGGWLGNGLQEDSNVPVRVADPAGG